MELIPNAKVSIVDIDAADLVGGRCCCTTDWHAQTTKTLRPTIIRQNVLMTHLECCFAEIVIVAARISAVSRPLAIVIGILIVRVAGCLGAGIALASTSAIAFFSSSGDNDNEIDLFQLGLQLVLDTESYGLKA